MSGPRREVHACLRDSRAPRGIWPCKIKIRVIVDEAARPAKMGRRGIARNRPA
jgi:hypothetical protein